MQAHQINNSNSEVSMTTAMKFVAEHKEKFERYRQWAISEAPRSEIRRRLAKLCWVERKYYREWMALS
ncbi:hypothetical protein PSI22_20545 [Xenorhabdus sp. XENO-7]|uniref:Uncharacterized protein n=1 Tax=Xenorhabdus aichiensis TaxID=3025874 RepID=A0ABT5M8C8_9GAMM|nr:hypothetical protein [Xenorhabdus aichiensis]MDC9623958.1 hypothetical protein [Xenorhabdus aichiensis]